MKELMSGLSHWKQTAYALAMACIQTCAGALTIPGKYTHTPRPHHTAYNYVTSPIYNPIIFPLVPFVLDFQISSDGMSHLPYIIDIYVTPLIYVTLPCVTFHIHSTHMYAPLLCPSPFRLSN